MAEESPSHFTGAYLPAKNQPIGVETSISDNNTAGKKCLDTAEIQVSPDVTAGDIVSGSGMLIPYILLELNVTSLIKKWQTIRRKNITS